MWRKIMERESVIVKFGGNISGVDVNTFTRTVLAYSAVARAACEKVDASKQLDIQIGSTSPGCLEVTLNITADIIQGMLDIAAASAPVLPSVINTAAEYYRLTKFLGTNGSPRTTTIDGDGESTRITAGNGSTITINRNTYSIYTDRPDVAKSIAGSFKELENNPEIEYIEIDGGDRPKGRHFKAVSGDFPAMSSAPQYAGEETKTVLIEKQNLAVLRVTLKKSTRNMWQFAWNGFPISANITDLDFFDNLDNYSFSIGDVMVVDLKVTKRYDRELKTYMNERYEVVKVRDKHNAPKTGQLAM